MPKAIRECQMSAVPRGVLIYRFSLLNQLRSRVSDQSRYKTTREIRQSGVELMTVNY